MTAFLRRAWAILYQTFRHPLATTTVDAMRPEVREAFEASWKQNEEAYRYLGRIRVSGQEHERTTNGDA